MLTSKCASRHNGVHFSISHLASWLCTRRFSKPTFRSSGATNHWKNIVIRDFSTFSRTCIFFLLILSLSDLLSSALLFSDSSHLCFSICPRCRKSDFYTSFGYYIPIKAAIGDFPASHVSLPDQPAKFVDRVGSSVTAGSLRLGQCILWSTTCCLLVWWKHVKKVYYLLI